MNVTVKLLKTDYKTKMSRIKISDREYYYD